jgi:hypothetical protein
MQTLYNFQLSRGEVLPYSMVSLLGNKRCEDECIVTSWAYHRISLFDRRASREAETVRVN